MVIPTAELQLNTVTTVDPCTLPSIMSPKEHAETKSRAQRLSGDNTCQDIFFDILRVFSKTGSKVLEEFPTAWRNSAFMPT